MRPHFPNHLTLTARAVPGVFGSEKGPVGVGVSDAPVLVPSTVKLFPRPRRPCFRTGFVEIRDRFVPIVTLARSWAKRNSPTTERNARIADEISGSEEAIRRAASGQFAPD